MSGYKKTASGKWISTEPPPIPPRNTAPRAAVPSATMSEMDASFVRDPLNFLRKHSMSPPDTGGAIPGREFNRTRAGPGEIVSGDLDSGIITRNAGGGIRYVKIIPHPAPNFPGAVSLNVSQTPNQPDTSWIPIHWLPWYTLRIMEYSIPITPSNLVDPPEQDFPRFFFTAGINGCSVFVRGQSTNPTVYHAGITGNLGRPAGAFWPTRWLPPVRVSRSIKPRRR